MPLVDAKCPNCGASIKVDPESKKLVCEFCNSEFVVEEAINKYNVEVNDSVINNKIENSTVVINNCIVKDQDLTKTQLINLDKIKCPDVDIQKLKMDVNKVGEEIEEKRKVLFGKYNKNRKINNILLVVVLAMIVGAFVMIVQQDKALQITGYCMAGVVLVGLITYYIVTKNKFPNATKEYIKDISSVMNGYTFSDDRFKEMVTNENTKIDMVDVTADRIYLAPTDIGSRNVCEGYFNDCKIKVAEMALYKQQNRKQRDVCFVGKYISLENKQKFDGRVLINIKGEKQMDAPTDIEDLSVISEEDNVIVYAAEGFKLSSAISTRAFSALKKIKVHDSLLNINIVIWGGHTAIYLSYDDAVISLPFDKPFEAKSLKQYGENLLTVLTALTEM